MKCYTVNGDKVVEGITVNPLPYPRVILGEGGHKRATWIPVGRRDADTVIETTMKSCPNRNKLREIGDEWFTCEACGTKYVDTDEKIKKWGQEEPVMAQKHPNTGEVVNTTRITDVGVVALKDKESGEPNGKFLLVAPRNRKDNCVVVFWSVSSGYRGSSGIEAGEGVKVIGYDHSWHSGRGSLGSTAEMLAILTPGQELIAVRFGRRVQDTRARLSYDGKEVKVMFGGEEMFVAIAEEVEGDYL
jgi:hypothetical protein